MNRLPGVSLEIITIVVMIIGVLVNAKAIYDNPTVINVKTKQETPGITSTGDKVKNATEEDAQLVKELDIKGESSKHKGTIDE